MFISPAFAQDAAGAGDPFAFLLPMVAIFAVFWFLMIRPQQKKMKEHKATVAAVKRGDKVVTAGGLIGTVTKVLSDTEAQVEVADGVRVRVVKDTISTVLAKPQPAGAKAANDDTKAQAASPQGRAGGLLGRFLGLGPKRD